MKIIVYFFFPQKDKILSVETCESLCLGCIASFYISSRGSPKRDLRSLAQRKKWKKGFAFIEVINFAALDPCNLG